MNEATIKLLHDLVAELEQEQLKRIHKWEPEEVIKYVAHRVESFSDSFMQLIFSKCRLKEIDCRNSLEDLRRMTDQIVFKDGLSSFMPRTHQEQYAKWLKEQRGEEPEPEKVQVSQILHDLESEITNPNERLFYEETRICLEAKAYRAAIVMGWNLTYDHLIRWIFSTRISQMTSFALARDLRYTPAKQVYSANSCHADRGTRWVTAKTRICGSILTAA